MFLQRLASKGARVRNRLRPGCIVLCYHRVSDDTDDAWRNAVSPRNFADHIACVTDHYPVVSIDTLVASLDGGHLPRRSVAITFDDGYAVNTGSASSTLIARRAPATFYLNTAWLTGGGFWWDDLADAADPSELPSLRSACQEMDDAVRRAMLQRRREQQGLPGSVRSECRPMEPGDVKTLGREPLFTIGGHTHTHPVLARVSRARQRDEIIENKRRLEALAAVPVQHFSYPFGGATDFTDETIEELRAAGIHSASTTLRGPVRWPCDPYRVPRLSVKNWDVRKFQRELEDLWGN